MSVTVRRFGPDDWQAARVARLASILDEFGPHSDFLREQSAIDEEAWRRVLREHVRFGAFDGDVPTGTVGWRPGPGGAGLLYGMWVHPDARGSGLADALVEAVAAEAVAHDEHTLTLKVEPDNARARAFYTRSGFRVTDGGDGLVVMTRALDAG